jgi:hypothetical protein
MLERVVNNSKAIVGARLSIACVASRWNFTEEVEKPIGSALMFAVSSSRRGKCVARARAVQNGRD